jgi:hypothetical protein
MIHISIVHWIAKPAVYFGKVISTHLKICWISPTQFGITTVVLQCSVEKSPSRKRVLLLKEGLDIYSNVARGLKRFMGTLDKIPIFYKSINKRENVLKSEKKNVERNASFLMNYIL